MLYGLYRGRSGHPVDGLGRRRIVGADGHRVVLAPQVKARAAMGGVPPRWCADVAQRGAAELACSRNGHGPATGAV